MIVLMSKLPPAAIRGRRGCWRLSRPLRIRRNRPWCHRLTGLRMLRVGRVLRWILRLLIVLGRWILGLGIWRVLLRLHVRLHLRLHLLLHLRLHVWLHVWLHRWRLHLRLWLWLRLWLVLRWLLLGRLRLGRLGRILAAIPGRTWVLRWIPAGGRCKTVLAPAGRRRLKRNQKTLPCIP